MSLQSVRDFLAEQAPDVEILVTQSRTPTVALAAEAHRVMPDQIAETLSPRLFEEVILLSMRAMFVSTTASTGSASA